MDNHRRGLAAGVSAYLLWGLFPLYWPLLALTLLSYVVLTQLVKLWPLRRK